MGEVWAVLVAAGQGERLGGDRPKAFAPLGGRPLLAEALERLDSCERVDAIIVVAPPQWEEPAILLAEEIGAAKVVAVVPGGTRSRAESVRIGVGEIPETADVVLVHDAARPLVSSEVIERVLEPLAEVDGAVPGIALSDTVKRVEDGIVTETVERAGLYTVQTPQAFRAVSIRQALEAWPEDATDCAAYVTLAGGRVRVVEGDPALLKVTTVADLEEVERRLGREPA
jgi:2-C-methyl-D-erythritol 4-phosphate cytidylyltransferase